MKLANIRSLFSIFIAGSMLLSCSSTKNKNMTTPEGSMGMSSPPAIVYKTTNDYDRNVPVTLSADKQKIISYPAPTDLRRGNTFVYPTKLNNGYLLDNRGISINTAFLKFTYEDYYNMDNVPTAERLMNYIADDDPFSEFYIPGKRGDYKNIVEELNEIIDRNELNNFKNLAQ